MRISKAWAPEGKWPVTDGVQRLKYFFEFVTYPSLDDLAADIARRIAEGTWTMVTGAPRSNLDLTKLHARNGKNFVDAPTVLFVTDFDGMTPDKGDDLSTSEAFGVAIVDTLRRRLDAAALHALSKAKLVLVTTASTGMALNSLGMPANGCARFRAIFEFDRPLTLKQQKTLVEKIGELSGLQAPRCDGGSHRELVSRRPDQNSRLQRLHQSRSLAERRWRTRSTNRCGWSRAASASTWTPW